MSPEDFDFLRKLLKERSGLVLAAEKQYLAESRLLPLARRHGISTLAELVGALKAQAAPALASDVVDAMTTNETFFFRDKLPFDQVRDVVLPALIAARAREKRIRIWCAAASTGQEPYSIAMTLKGMEAALAGFRVDILATDLVGDMLERAKAGIYSQFEVQRGLPIQMLVKYFRQVDEAWQIVPELRNMVQFRTLNLLNDFSPLGRFRPGVLPQRADLFRSAEQDPGAGAAGAPDAGRRLFDSGRRRDGGRPHRCFQTDAGTARALRAQRRTAPERQDARHGDATCGEGVRRPSIAYCGFIHCVCQHTHERLRCSSDA